MVVSLCVPQELLRLRYLLTDGDVDRGTANGLSILVVLAGLMLVGLWCLFSRRSLRTIMGGRDSHRLLVISASLFKIRQVDGNLQFYFAPRWTKPADIVLAEQNSSLVAAGKPI